MANDYISTEKDEDVIRDEKVLVEHFNESYITVATLSSRKSRHPYKIIKILSRTMPQLTKLYQNIVLIPESKKLKGNFL